MRGILSFCLVTCLASVAYTQYWFGPKVGVSYIDHVYQDKLYKDTFDVKPNVNMQYGVAMSYTATDMYAVYGELVYERIGKRVNDIRSGGEDVNMSMTNHFLSAPVMLRVTLGTVPFHYYVNGGPRLSYWLGGSGKQFLTEFVENLPDPEDTDAAIKDYTIKFDRSKVETNGNTAYIDRPNRLQFGLTVGGGMFFDIQGGARLQLDFRYTWVHSNMGSNSGPDDINFNYENYRENFEYYHNIATVGVAYLFGYNSELKRKGKSTSKESNKRKK
ncbi:Outer membrane protein beta-barrel domain-containing protein [Ekhidna lutea]|uniref:Outer membrane protein beta-barrel domain-containing protein n=1 Tax=Ekhidna lutea TaxID=447679 RepID=A0A239GHF4_EKHLU|nr:outer membrane beta-barrel protein [Ekhidna lutea]SNS68627.1 Outer membrane protein beta-barrel domain-containing protein [Ekhidna lutea]